MFSTRSKLFVAFYKYSIKKFEDFIPCLFRSFRLIILLQGQKCWISILFLTFKSLQDPVGISKSQLGEFHKLFEESSKDTTKKLKNNFRPEQDLNSRVVFDVDTSIKHFSNGFLFFLRQRKKCNCHIFSFV